MSELIELTIPPEQASYAVTDGTEVISVQLDGGAARRRKDILGATSTVNVLWKCNPAKYKYLRAFYRAVAEGGATPFTIGLLLDEPDIVQHKAYFIPGTMSLQSQSGETYMVAAQLEVYPKPPNPHYFDYVVLYNMFGEDSSFITLDKTINVDYPNILENV